MSDDDQLLRIRQVTALANEIAALLRSRATSVPMGEAALIFALGVTQGFHGGGELMDDPAGLALYRHARTIGAMMRQSGEQVDLPDQPPLH